MEVIVKGKHPSERKILAVCKSCGCVFMYVAPDINSSGAISCPTCGTSITVKKVDKDANRLPARME